MKQQILFLALSLSMSLAWGESRKMQLSGKDIAAAEDENGKVELEIASVDIKIKVHGVLASTRLEFSIHNPSDTDAQADFILPLPQNSTVTGYALDIEGEMVDGVYVEKAKARFAYNDIVSQMIDPGLLEAKDDDSYSVNVYPVPEGGKRVFSIEFVTDTAEYPYELPLNYADRVQEASLSIEMEGFNKLPRIRYPSGMHSNPDRRKQGVYVKNRWKNIRLNGSLSIQSVESKQDRLIVEKSGTGDYYFLIEDRIEQPADVSRIVPDHITLFWDASISRENSNREAELELLERLIKSIDAENLTVDAVVFRDRREESKTYTLKDHARPLIEHLRSIHNDGASNLEAALKAPIHANNDYCLLFTDTQINYGAPDLGVMPCRMYIVSSGLETNHYLESLALQSGGDYFSLPAEKPENIVMGIGATPLRLLSYTVGSGGAMEGIYTETIKPVNNRLRVSGRLTSAEAGITLNYGTSDAVIHSQAFELRQSDAANSESARLMWAGNKIKALRRTARPDRKAIIGISQQHGVLSPYTSLLVLEDPDQYAEYRIEPPATQKEWVKEYRDQIEELEEERQEHFDEMVSQWNNLVKWWETDFALQPKKAHKRPRQPAPQSPPDAVTAEDMGRFPDDTLAESVQRSSGVIEESMDEEVMVSGIRANLEEPAGPSISVKPWSPDRVYLTELSKVGPEQYFDKYMELRQEYGLLPAYYMEVADFLKGKNKRPLALQVLSNLVELETGDYTTRRILGYKLLEYGELALAIRVLENVLEENANEPQSFRDLALALIQHADRSLKESTDRQTVDAARRNYLRGVDLLYNVVLEPWDDRFEGIALIALMEINRAIAKCRGLGIKSFNVDQRLIKLLGVDMRVVAAWHADQVDMDLWVIEPTEETANYGNSLTEIGGRISNDMTAGFGPEEYLLKKAVKGKYAIKVDYYGASGIMPTGAVKLMVDVYTNYARPNEKREVLTIELEREEDEYLVGEIEF